jgi:hypothetical protein
MRPEFLGDSFDIVKRFFGETLRSLGYTVYIDPLFSGDWSGKEDNSIGSSAWSTIHV